MTRGRKTRVSSRRAPGSKAGPCRHRARAARRTRAAAAAPGPPRSARSQTVRRGAAEAPPFFSEIGKQIVTTANKISKICRKFSLRAVQKCENLVDLEKCCKLSIWTQKSALIQLIQPRTSPPRFDVPAYFGGALSINYVCRP